MGAILRLFGALAIGIFVGWISKNILTDAAKNYKLQIAVYVGLLAAMVTMPRYAGAGDMGAFTLGVGVGALIPAILARRTPPAAK